MIVSRNNAAGLQTQLRNTHTIFHKHDVQRSTTEHMEATILIPGRGWRVARFSVLQEFDSHIAEWVFSKIPRDVRKSAGSETGFAKLQLERHRSLPRNVILNFRW